MSPHICIGAREDAKNLEALKELGVTHILNCAKQLPSSHSREFVHARLELAGQRNEKDWASTTQFEILSRLC